ncbi:MAG: hypothetical protein Q4G60_10595 [bacterium]|nr:hypothetical protein [bacterium]
MKNNVHLAFAVMWISVAIAVSVGIYVTKSAGCLWAFAFPAVFYVGNSK